MIHELLDLQTHPIQPLENNNYSTNILEGRRSAMIGKLDIMVQRGCLMLRGLHFAFTHLAGLSMYLAGSAGDLGLLSPKVLKKFSASTSCFRPVNPWMNQHIKKEIYKGLTFTWDLNSIQLVDIHFLTTIRRQMGFVLKFSFVRSNKLFELIFHIGEVLTGVKIKRVGQ